METRIQSQNFGAERAVRFQMLNKCYIYPPHIHQYAELVILLEENLTITVDGKTETITPGQAAFLFPFQVHRYFSHAINRLAIFVFSPSMLPDFFHRTAGKVGEGSVFTPSQTTLSVFREKIFDREDFDLFDIKGALYLALGDFLAGAELRESDVDTSLSSSVVNYVNDHVTDEISLRTMARELGYNPNYLSGRIHEIFGFHLPTLIASIRADKAKYLLLETDKTGLEICYECGFGSERSFHRQFKAITGSTPKEYRAHTAHGAINHGVIKYF